MATTKGRHGCLTAWLILMIIANAVTALTYVVLILFGRKTVAPAWALLALAVACIANVLFAVALFRWKKWGFFGFLGTTILTLVINLRNGIKPTFASIGLFGIVILYAVLQIGGERKGWNQLE
jgi:xanthosine utilization system XapX-like protein